MRFVHTFWSKPLYNNKFNTFNNSLNCILSNYGYSAACIKSFGEKIILYADEKGAELLSFILYDEVIIIDGLENESIHCAAQLKFEALKQYKDGDVIIDGDLFIQNDKSLDFIKNYDGDVLYSFYEPFEYLVHNLNIQIFSGIFYNLQRVELMNGYKLPVFFKDMGWPNTSLMKFNNKQALQDYIAQYKYHKDIIKNINFNNGWPDVIIEQYFLKCLCENKGYIYKPVIEGYPHKEANDYALEIGFTHLGSRKINYLEIFNEKFQKLNSILFNKYKNQYNNYSI